MTFAELFAGNRGEPIQVDGAQVIAMLRRAVRPGCTVRVRILAAVQAPIQGVRIKIIGGKLLSGSKRFDDIVLWRDTAPQETTLVCSARKDCEVRIWNCWRDEREVMHAWVGNAGMRVREGEGVLTFECNSGPEVTFADLVFEVSFEEE